MAHDEIYLSEINSFLMNQQSSWKTSLRAAYLVSCPSGLLGTACRLSWYWGCYRRAVSGTESRKTLWSSRHTQASVSVSEVSLTLTAWRMSRQWVVWEYKEGPASGRASSIGKEFWSYPSQPLLIMCSLPSPPSPPQLFRRQGQESLLICIA